MRKFIILATLLLAGCMSINKTSEVSIDSILALSEQIDVAEKRGWIDNVTEDELQNNLIDALKLLKSAYSVTDVRACANDLTRNECLNVILLDIEQRLTEAQNAT